MERIGPIQSVERAIWILKCFEDCQELSLAELSRKLGIHKNTVFGLVTTLKAYGLLAQNQETTKYRLGMELYRLGSYVSVDLRSVVTPYLNRLVDLCGETANLMVPDGGSVLYLEKKESPHSIIISTKLGLRLPLHITAGGKAILSRMPEESARAILAEANYEPRTDKTLTSPEAVMSELIQIRRCGYAVDNEELEYGLLCLGTAIVNSTGEPVAAISISGPIQRMDPETQKRYSEYLLNFGREISAKL